MTARPHEKDEDPPAAAEPLDPAFVERCQESLADPRPDIPAEEVFAELRKLAELLEDLEAIGSPPDGGQERDPFQFPDRPGL